VLPLLQVDSVQNGPQSQRDHLLHPYDDLLEVAMQALLLGILSEVVVGELVAELELPVVGRFFLDSVVRQVNVGVVYLVRLQGEDF